MAIFHPAFTNVGLLHQSCGQPEFFLCALRKRKIAQKNLGTVFISDPLNQK